MVRPPPALTTAAVIEEFIEAAEQGRAVNRSGRRYRPSALRDLSGILRYHVAPDLGEMPLREVRRSDIQQLVNRLAEERLSESRIRSVISAIRALYSYAIEQQGYAEFNPADGLVMPSGEGTPRSEEVPRQHDTPTWQDTPSWDDTRTRDDTPIRDDTPTRDATPTRNDTPTRDDPRGREEPPAGRTRDRWRPSGGARSARKEPQPPKRPEREPGGYQPLAVLPERILTVALRALIVLFIVVALISLLQPA